MSDQPSGLAVDGEGLRRLRKMAGYNLVTFAAEIDISWGYLSQIERGHRQNVSPQVFARICEKLGLAELADREALLKVPAA